MKKGIHPEYKNTTIKCVCGNVIETRSTVGGEMTVEICSACHPFFTGKQKLVDTAGRVERFRRKYKLEPAAEASAETKPAEVKPAEMSPAEMKSPELKPPGASSPPVE